MISKLGRDEFGRMARDIWAREGIATALSESEAEATGAAFIYVDDATGANAIIVVPGAAASLSATDVEAAADAIRASAVFVTQLEQPLAAARRGLEIAKAAGAITVFNPAPAMPVEPGLYALCDYVTPNESEAAQLTGVPVATVDDARRAGDAFLDMGAGMAVITLAEKGVLLHSRDMSLHIPAFEVSPVVETAGAGDAFNGAFAAALADGKSAEAGRPLRLRRCRHLGHPPGNRAVDAAPRRGSGAAGAVTRESVAPHLASAGRVGKRPDAAGSDGGVPMRRGRSPQRPAPGSRGCRGRCGWAECRSRSLAAAARPWRRRNVVEPGADERRMRDAGGIGVSQLLLAEVGTAAVERAVRAGHNRAIARAETGRAVEQQRRLAAGNCTRLCASSGGLACCSGARARVAKTEVADGPIRLAMKIEPVDGEIVEDEVVDLVVLRAGDPAVVPLHGDVHRLARRRRVPAARLRG